MYLKVSKKSGNLFFLYLPLGLTILSSFSGHELERSEDGRISIEAVDFEDPAREVLKYRVGYLSREGKPQFTTSWSIISAWENLDLPSGITYYSEAQAKRSARKMPCDGMHQHAY